MISRFCQAFVIRTFADADVAAFAAAASIPVVNALTDGHHPLQSLADLLTLRDRFGRAARACGWRTSATATTSHTA